MNIGVSVGLTVCAAIAASWSPGQIVRPDLPQHGPLQIQFAGYYTCKAADLALSNIARGKAHFSDVTREVLGQMASAPGAGTSRSYSVTCPMYRELETAWQEWSKAVKARRDITECYGQSLWDAEVAELQKQGDWVKQGLKEKCTD